MAKKAQQKLSLDEAPEIQSVSYRIERVDAFAWQGYQLTVHRDGSITETSVHKNDILDIVLQKINSVMRSEGQVKFMAKKAKHA